MINKNFKIKKIIKPFPYIIIDEFFEQDFYLELEKNFPKAEDFTINNVGRMHGDTTYGDTLYKKLLIKSNAYKKLHDWVYNKQFIDYFVNFFEKDINHQPDLIGHPKKFEKISKPVEIGKVFNLDNFQNNTQDPFLYSRLDLGYGKKNYGVSTGGRGPHIDNPQRLISILIYIGGYKSIKGGEHRIYQLKGEKLQVFDEIKPLENRLIASLQNNSAFHDVNPVSNISGQRNAFYLAISASKKIWKPCKRNRINKNFNKNRVEKNFLEKLIKKITN